MRGIHGIGIAAVMALAGGPAPEAPAAGKPEAKVRIRPAYRDGRRLRYRLTLDGATAWAPNPAGELAWGKMGTDFTFVLATKAVRTAGLLRGSCTFELLGERLRSDGEGPEGALGIDATRDRTRVKVRDRWQVSVADKSPLRRPMTLTFGPRGACRFGTGLAPIAVYFLPGVDPRFWTLLTIAPDKPVAPGDAWEQAFDLPVPGATGRPLKLTGKWQVLGWQDYASRPVMAMTLSADLKLADTNLTLRNGDRVHVASGTYRAEGLVRWDPAKGVLCYAAAEQNLLAKADKPTPRALRHRAKCTLQLLAATDAESK